MVFGIQWLAKLGPILWDFKNLRMEFVVDGRKFMLRSATTGPKKLVQQIGFKRIQGVCLKHLFSIQGDKENKVGNEQQGSCPTCFQKTRHGKIITRFNKSFHNFSPKDKASLIGDGMLQPE